MTKYVLILLLLILCFANLFAQQDSTRKSEPKKLVTTQLRELLGKAKLERLETLKVPENKMIDSLKNVSKSKVDSLQSVPTSVSESLNQKTDSLNKLVHIPIDGVNQRITEIQNQIQSVGDSIQGNVQQKIDKLSNKATSAQETVQNKADSIQNKVASSITSMQEKTESKILEITGEKVNIPGTDKLNLPSGELPNSTSPNVKVPSSDIILNGIVNTKVDLPQTGKLSLDTPDLKSKLPDTDILDPTKLDKVNELTGEVQKLDGKLAEAEKYEGDLQKLKEDAPKKLEKLPEQAEQKVTDLLQVKAVKGEIAKTAAEQAKYEALIKQYQDKKFLQEELKRKSLAVANDYLAQNASKVQEAQKQLGKSKNGISKIKNVKDVFKSRSDELVGKKIYQRLVPGTTWQIYNKDFVSIDFALQVGYRLSPKVTAGAGGIYRLGFNKDFNYFVKDLHTYGGRAYLDFFIAKGVFAHGEFEVLKLGTPLSPTTKDISDTNTYGSYFGLGKRFNISRNFRGNIQALYRVDYEGEPPSLKKVSARFGIDYVFRKPKKKLRD